MFKIPNNIRDDIHWCVNWQNGGTLHASDWSTLSNQTTNFVLAESFLCYSNHQNNDRVILPWYNMIRFL